MTRSRSVTVGCGEPLTLAALGTGALPLAAWPGRTAPATSAAPASTVIASTATPAGHSRRERGAGAGRPVGRGGSGGSFGGT